MFTNKHVIVAVLVAPVLAIMAFYGVDHVVSEKPHSAKEGSSYQLVAKSNCRYGSGACTFKNGDMKIQITLAEQNDSVLVTLTSDIPLSGVKLSLAEANTENLESLPQELTSITGEPYTWQGNFDLSYSGDELLRMVASAGGAMYFGETVAAFGNRESPYGANVPFNQQ